MTYQPWPEGGADQMETALLEQWTRERLFQQTLEATRDGAPFVFYEGPPTANGKPGIHHVFARTIKDLICRFQAMRGRQVTRIAGWDAHGLPVEIEVEKQLKLNGKKAIEDYGVEAFNRLCLESVFTYKADWEALSTRIGYWLDFEHPYATYTNEYVETVWWLLSRLFERNLLYRGHRVLPYCPRCGTVLSSHELALGYEEVKDRSIYVTFPLTDGSGRELVVWTTTPWTLPSNVAAAVHPERTYGLFRSDRHAGRTFIAAESRAEKLTEVLGGEVSQVGTLPGSELVGLRYQRPFDIVPMLEGGDHSVIVPGTFVTAADGSGIVHMAPAFGADDYAAGQEHGLALLRPVAADGTFQGTSWPELEGRLVTAEETNELIVRRLKTEGRWLRTEQYVHTYPHCWRCRSKLIYYARDSWFVRTSEVRERMLEINRGVNWQPPEVGQGRFGSWLENNVDWALSRDRYWGTPLPVWVCDQEPAHVEVVGSYAQLAARWGRPLPADFDPHKPFIDAYTWTCDCGGSMRRAREVIDTWFDSGSMPYAQWHYPFEHAEEFAAHFPADYICEGVDQTRGWFYSLLAIATTAFDGPAYRNVIVNELVLDADGQKMSKSRGNVVDPWELIQEFGADTARLYLLVSSQVWLPKRFDRRQIAQVTGDFLRALRNTYEFYRLYAEPGVAPPPPPSARPDIDRWILARLEATVADVTSAWAGYEPTAGVRGLMDFVVDDLSNWYVRVTRERFWAPDGAADAAAVATLEECLVTVSRLLAPAAPFASDWLHRALRGGSVHLAGWPMHRHAPEAAPGAPASAGADAELLTAMDAIRRLASLARSARESGKIRVRQPLGQMQVAVPGTVPGPVFDGLLTILQAEVNVRRIVVAASDTELVRLRAKPNFRTLGKRYGKETPVVAAAAQQLSAEQLRELETGGQATLHVNGQDVVYFSEDVVVEREVATSWLVASDGPYVAALDPAIDAELAAEGLAREVVHHVQRLRREAGFVISDRIVLAAEGPAPVLAAAAAHRDFICTETLARQLQLGQPLPDADLRQHVDLDGHDVTLSVRRLQAGA